MQGSFAPVRALFSPFDGRKILQPFAQKTFGFYKLQGTYSSQNSRNETLAIADHEYVEISQFVLLDTEL